MNHMKCVLPLLCFQQPTFARILDLEQLAAAASLQHNSDDTASQVAAWNSIASGFGHRRHPHWLPRSRLPIAAARGRRLLMPSRGRRRLGRRLIARCRARLVGVPLWLHTCALCTSCLQRSARSRSTVPIKKLGADQCSWRTADKFQILSWNPGPARGSDQRALGTWHIICVQEAADFVTSSSLEENFYIANQLHCAVVLNIDTFLRSVRAHLRFMGGRGYGCPWQVPPNTTSTTSAQKENGLYCTAPPDPRPVLEVQYSRVYRRLLQGS